MPSHRDLDEQRSTYAAGRRLASPRRSPAIAIQHPSAKPTQYSPNSRVRSRRSARLNHPLQGSLLPQSPSGRHRFGPITAMQRFVESAARGQTREIRPRRIRDTEQRENPGAYRRTRSVPTEQPRCDPAKAPQITLSRSAATPPHSTTSVVLVQRERVRARCPARSHEPGAQPRPSRPALVPACPFRPEPFPLTPSFPPATKYKRTLAPRTKAALLPPSQR